MMHKMFIMIIVWANLCSLFKERVIFESLFDLNKLRMSSEFMTSCSSKGKQMRITMAMESRKSTISLLEVHSMISSSKTVWFEEDLIDKKINFIYIAYWLIDFLGKNIFYILYLIIYRPRYLYDSNKKINFLVDLMNTNREIKNIITPKFIFSNELKSVLTFTHFLAQFFFFYLHISRPRLTKGWINISKFWSQIYWK